MKKQLASRPCSQGQEGARRSLVEMISTVILLVGWVELSRVGPASIVINQKRRSIDASSSRSESCDKMLRKSDGHDSGSEGCLIG